MNKILTSLVIVGSLVTAPAFAQRWERHDGYREHGHERQEHGWERNRNNDNTLLGLGLGAVIIGGGLCAAFCGQAPLPPPVYYAPPRVYAPPPPVYYAPPPPVYYAPPRVYAPPPPVYYAPPPVYMPYRY